jgi:hypothetical protein
VVFRSSCRSTRMTFRTFKPHQPTLNLNLLNILYHLIGCCVTSAVQRTPLNNNMQSTTCKLNNANGYGREEEQNETFPGNFSLHHCVQNGSGAHPASYPMGTRGSFPGDVKLTTHLHLVPKSENAWSYTLTPQYALMGWCLIKAQRQLYLYLTFRGSSVSTVTILHAGRQRFGSRQGQYSFSWLPRSDRLWGPLRLLSNGFLHLNWD